MSFQPIGERVVLELDKAERFTPAGLTIPDSMVKNPNKGTVLAVGEEAQNRISEGDVILFDKFSGDPVTVEGKDLVVVHLRHIIGKFK